MSGETDQADGLWEPPRTTIVMEIVLGVVMLGVAATNLGADPTGWERVGGYLAALVGGLAIGVGLCLVHQGRMVRRHMATQHPGVAIPSAPKRRPRR